MKKLVIALGGNALEDSNIPSAENQLEVIKSNIPYLVDLIEENYNLVITHGNGPQIGRIILQSENSKDITPALPFDVCGAMSQGMIGYQIQQSFENELKKRNIKKNVISLITQVMVDKKDPAFENPSKPIGPFYSKEEALELQKTKNYQIREDAGRGYRRVVPSPKPIEIVEISSIKNLVNAHTLVITAGGGGIPVILNPQTSCLEGIAAVIDKDFASSKLAQDIDADTLVILTAVDTVYINYGKDNQQSINNISISELNTLIEEKHFAEGSMLPKIIACMDFVKSNPARKALITSLNNVKNAFVNNCGTWIINDK